MPGKAFILGAALVVGLTVAAFGINAYVTRQQHLAQRYHLLCEVLQPGMSRDEALAVLAQYGTFTVAGAEDTSPNVDLHVVFADIRGRNGYGAFDLSFWHGRYNMAYIRGFDSVDVICDFSTISTPAMKTRVP